MNELGPRFLLTLAVILAAVGAVDSAVSDEWDLLAIFVVVTIILLFILFRQRMHRVSVTLRPDLAHWIEDRAESSGDPFDDVLDRAIASFKHGMVADE